MSDSINELLVELTEAPGVPGFEEPVRKLLDSRLSGLAEISHDRLGSFIARKTGSADSPRIMFAGHMDEVGFMVTYITDEGYLKFQTLGGWWEQVMLAQRVVVHTRKGELMGVIGSKPPHILSADERKKIVEKKDMFIDIGVESKEEAIALGVRPGDPVVPVCPSRRWQTPSLSWARPLTTESAARSSSRSSRDSSRPRTRTPPTALRPFRKR